MKVYVENVQKLLNAILGESWQKAPLPQTDWKIVSGLLLQVVDDLNHREAEIIKLYFGLTDGQSPTLEEIGDHFSRSSERIRQIKDKALRRLRHPTRIGPIQDIINGDVTDWNNLKQQQAQLEIKYLGFNPQEIELIGELSTAFEKFDQLRKKIGLEWTKDVEAVRRKALDIEIDELELSIRTWNCLRAADIQTVGDLLKKAPHPNDLLKFRNFGRKSAQELHRVIEQLGIEWRDGPGGITK